MQPRRIGAMLPDDVRHALRDLGSDISAARRLRRMSQEELAERIGVARATVARLEAGTPAVALGTLVAAAWVMGLEKQLAGALAPERDPEALRALRLDLPQRVRSSRPDGDDPSLDF